MTSTAKTRAVKLVNINKGSFFLVGDERVEFLAADYPSDGTVALWIKNSKGEYETLYRWAGESVECPILGV